MVYENLSKALHTSPTSVLEHSHRYFNSYLNKSLASLLRYQQTRCGPAYRGDNSYTNKQANYRSQIGLSAGLMTRDFFRGNQRSRDAVVENTENVHVAVCRRKEQC